MRSPMFYWHLDISVINQKTLIVKMQFFEMLRSNLFKQHKQKNGINVTFSGTLVDDQIPEKTYTELEINGNIREKDLPEEFATKDYQVLLVADKYQTGFDQPLLHTMYVDKRLGGIQAVQTLSRLNRTHALKKETFILDFVNLTG